MYITKCYRCGKNSDLASISVYTEKNRVKDVLFLYTQKQVDILHMGKVFTAGNSMQTAFAFIWYLYSD